MGTPPYILLLVSLLLLVGIARGDQQQEKTTTTVTITTPTTGSIYPYLTSGFCSAVKQAFMTCSGDDIEQILPLWCGSCCLGQRPEMLGYLTHPFMEGFNFNDPNDTIIMNYPMAVAEVIPYSDHWNPNKNQTMHYFGQYYEYTSQPEEVNYHDDCCCSSSDTSGGDGTTSENVATGSSIRRRRQSGCCSSSDTSGGDGTTSENVATGSGIRRRRQSGCCSSSDTSGGDGTTSENVATGSSIRRRRQSGCSSDTSGGDGTTSENVATGSSIRRRQSNRANREQNRVIRHQHGTRDLEQCANWWTNYDPEGLCFPSVLKYYLSGAGLVFTDLAGTITMNGTDFISTQCTPEDIWRPDDIYQNPGAFVGQNPYEISPLTVTNANESVCFIRLCIWTWCSLLASWLI